MPKQLKKNHPLIYKKWFTVYGKYVLTNIAELTVSCRMKSKFKWAYIFFLAAQIHTHTHILKIRIAEFMSWASRIWTIFCLFQDISLHCITNFLKCPPLCYFSPSFCRNANVWAYMKLVPTGFFLFLPVVCVSKFQFILYSSYCSRLGCSGDTKMNKVGAPSLVKSK